MSNTLISLAHNAWNNAADFRARRLRYLRFAYGNQWLDPAEQNPRLSEARAAIKSGTEPVTNNLIRPLLKTIVGRFRADNTKSYPKKYPGDINLLSELDARALEEYLISGCAIQRVAPDTRAGVESIYVDNINPSHLFINSYADPRGSDITLIGVLHDMSIAEIITRFGRRDSRRIARIAKCYKDLASAGASPMRHLGNGISESAGDFFIPAPGRHRVIEMWTLDVVTRPKSATDIATRWTCRWLTPDGHILHRTVSSSGTHPFAVKLYPLTDGAVHPFVEDLIDQQKSVNRLVSMINRMVAHSAKGVLTFPLDQLPSNYSLADIAELWASFDGIIPIKHSGGTQPQQLIDNNVGQGVANILNIQMQLFQDISGVSTALMARDPGNAGSSLYHAQTENAVIALADILHSFSSFIDQRDRLLKAN